MIENDSGLPPSGSSAQSDPLDPPERLAALNETGLLDTPADPAFDRLARLAARFLSAPVAQVNLIDRTRQFSKSSVGPEAWAGPRSVPLDASYCKHVVASGEPLVVEDAREHPLVRENRATREAGIVAYAAAPVEVEGHTLGTVCVVDFQPREWPEEDLEVLRDLAASVATEIQLRRDLRRLEHAESQLRKVSDQFHLVMENLREVIWIYDARQKRTLYASPAYELVWGMPREMLYAASQAWVESIHPEDRKRVLAANQRQNEGERYAAEYRILRPDGEVRWIRDHGFPVRGEHGGVDRVVGIAEDITERKQQEEALRASEERFRQLADNVREVFWTFTPDFTETLYVNPSYETVFGLPVEGVYENPTAFLEVVHREDSPPLLAAMERVRDQPQVAEFRILRPDGEVRHLRARGTPIRDERGKVYRVTGLTEDVTERKRAEEENQRRAEMVRLLQEAAIAANEAESVEEALREVIERVCAHTGFTVGHAYLVAPDDELLPSDLWYLADAERYGGFRSATSATRFASGQGLPSGVVATRQPTWIVDALLDPSFLRADAAREAGLHTALLVPVCLGEDVMAVLEFFTWAQLEPNALLLETVANVGTQLGRVFERQRAEAAVHRAREQAERASRAKSEFLSRMSHELRTPMNAILGFAQLLELDAQREEDREGTHQILRAGRHLLSLIDEVLDLAKIEAERMTLSLEPVYIPGLVRGSLDLIRSAAAERGITIHLAEGVCERHVRADQQRLKQVLLNLLSNAVKYNRQGGSVEVSCAILPEERISLEVRDTGYGIPMEKVDRLFTPFDRLGAERLRVEGTGLGLALTKGLVEAMGGVIGVRSTPGEGSTFWVELPLVDSPAEETPEAEDEEAAAEAPSIESRTILYIEDNLSNLRLVERILARRPNVALLPALQGSLGLELARERRPDLILLDIHLPDMAGDKVLERLMADPDLQETPVVVISADATERQVERFLAAGARAYLTKPFEIKRFIEVLDETLGAENA